MGANAAGGRAGTGTAAPAAALDPSRVNVRHKIAALWASMLFVFVYVDLFTVYRSDFQTELEAGKVNGFAVGQTFLLATTVFVVVPSTMVFLTLVLPAPVDRIANLVLSAVYGLIIVGGAIGEWNYYILGSAVEVAQLAALGFYAFTWPRLRHVGSSDEICDGRGSSPGRRGAEQ